MSALRRRASDYAAHRSAEIRVGADPASDGPLWKPVEARIPVITARQVIAHLRIHTLLRGRHHSGMSHNISGRLRLGEMQAKMIQLEALGERVSGLAGLNPADVKPALGSGGALVAGRSLTMEELQATLADLDKLTDQRVDLMTVVESRLFDQKIKKLMVPTQQPVIGGLLGSAFGWRIDPLNGRSALHTGLDFPSEPGTPILAAAGGVVVAQEYHQAYGNMVEIDHGNDLVSRYAHASRVFVKKGDLIKRGQKIAEVGTTGRSTGPHLHFEVLVQGVFQDPQKFLLAGKDLPSSEIALATAKRPSSAAR